MDDTSHLPSFWKLQAIGWGSLYLWALMGAFSDQNGWRDAVRVDTEVFVLMLLATSALRPICRSLVRRQIALLSFELRAAVLSVALGNSVSLFINIQFQNLNKFAWPDFVASSMQFSLLLFTWCSLYFSIKQWQRFTFERERFLRAETEAREARLQALRYQLNPHFLFNSLNSVSTLVLDGKADAATQMLAQIGDLLRVTLGSESAVEVPLSQEKVFTERYLAIEQTRLQDRLHVDMAISPETSSAFVPNMLLQPLVENAIRYGVGPLVQGGKIAIESTVQRGNLRIVVRNSGPKGVESSHENGNGIGLNNTAERLKTLYGSNHKFILEWPEDGGCVVTIELPFRSNPQLREVSTCAH